MLDSIGIRKEKLANDFMNEINYSAYSDNYQYVKMINNYLDNMNIFTIKSFVSTKIDNSDYYEANGEIDLETSQRYSGDCWLLSAINALNQTEAGKEVIRNAIKFQKDGNPIVSFKGINRDYKIPQEVIAYFNDEMPYYSEGDDDMLILELAAEKLREDIYNVDFLLTNEAKKQLHWPDRNIIKKRKDNSKSYINGGLSGQILNFLSGKEIKLYTRIKDIVKEFENSQGKNKAYTCVFGETKSVEDVNGNAIQLYKKHMYAISDINEDSVSIINPWDSSEEIELPKETFCKIVKFVEECDLAGEDKTYIIEPDEIDEDNNKTYYAQHISILGLPITAKTVYDENGNLIQVNNCVFDDLPQPFVIILNSIIKR